MTVSHEFLAGLPKAELHVHHVGSASPRIVSELAARHPGSPVPADPALLTEYFKFSDFAHFIDIYLSVVELIKTPEDVRLLTYEIAREMGRPAEPAVRRCQFVPGEVEALTHGVNRATQAGPAPNRVDADKELSAFAMAARSFL